MVSHPYFLSWGGKDITGYTANKFLQGIHKCIDIIHLHDLKTLTVTSDHMCSVPCLSTNRVLLATILSGVQGGINFIVNNINVEFSFSTLKQWYSQNMPPVGEKCDKACSGLRSDIASIDRCIRFDDKLLYNGYEKKMRRDAEY